MLTDRPLRIEVLVNSPGPHDQVRIREPFGALQQLGVDCRIHERPFRFSSCIRPHSLVIWQRPLPESRQRQWEHLQWLRERGCLLLTEWDDHPDLFPESIRRTLAATDMAAVQICHMLHTSNAQLLDALGPWQPLGVAFDNTLSQIPAANLDKHQTPRIRVFIGNQNRQIEHAALVHPLKTWIRHQPGIQIVVVGDNALAQQLPKDSLEHHKLMPYSQYRRLLSSCHIALLPLANNLANCCKTPIKLLEAAAESVATISGPGLYPQWSPWDCTLAAPSLDAVVPLAATLAADVPLRQHMVQQAHQWAKAHWALGLHTPYRLWMYQQLWQKRQRIDRLTIGRLATIGGIPPMHRHEFHR